MHLLFTPLFFIAKSKQQQQIGYYVSTVTDVGFVHGIDIDRTTGDLYINSAHSSVYKIHSGSIWGKTEELY